MRLDIVTVVADEADQQIASVVEGLSLAELRAQEADRHLQLLREQAATNTESIHANAFLAEVRTIQKQLQLHETTSTTSNATSMPKE